MKNQVHIQILRRFPYVIIHLLLGNIAASNINRQIRISIDKDHNGSKCSHPESFLFRPACPLPPFLRLPVPPVPRLVLVSCPDFLRAGRLLRRLGMMTKLVSVRIDHTPKKSHPTSSSSSSSFYSFLLLMFLLLHFCC